MDEYTFDAFVNRDEPIPVIAVAPQNNNDASKDAGSRREKIKEALTPSRLRNRPADISTTGQQVGEEPPASPSTRSSIQDRLFSSLLRQVIPADDSEEDSAPTPIDPRSSLYVSRPAFSLPVMTNNFRRFNARIGIVFVFQNRLIRLFTWRTPTHTLSFLATYSFICLDPYLLIVVPLAIALFYIMIPAFTSRHPPPPPPTLANTSTGEYHQAFTGPALAPATVIKPASETSKDFFRNMRDLQNSMADFSNGHDALVSTITPATNFSDEMFSSQLFFYLTILTTLSFITAHLLPWRLIFFLAGWSFTVSSHPTAQSYLLKLQKQAEQQTTLALNDPSHKHKKYIPNTGIPLPATPHAIQSAFTKFSEITLSTRPETMEVEVFELQHRPLASLTSSNKSSASEWRAHLFTPHPYDPLSPARIAGDRPRGTRFFEDVEAPEGWQWAGKKWELDLEAGEWVNERLVVGVEYDVLSHDIDEEDDVKPLSAQAASGPGDYDKTGNLKTKSEDDNRLRRISTSRRESINLDFGGWVWDLPPIPGSGANRDDDLWLAYGDYDITKAGAGSSSKEDEKNKKKKDKDNKRKEKSTAEMQRDWEEATRLENRGRTGEWRRRRWVRLVKRKITT